MADQAKPVDLVDAETRTAAAPQVDRFRHELRGTLLIVVGLVAILAAGWLGTVVTGREATHLGPGVTLVIGPGWGPSYVGPMGILSSTRRIGRSELTVSAVYETATPDQLLDRYHREVMIEQHPDAVLEEAEPVVHAGGDALRQRWSNRGPDGTLYQGELIVVANAGTGVALDAHWPEDEDPAVVAEIRRVTASLRIEPGAP